MAEPVQRHLSINATPERVFAVITNFDDYPNWQKEIEATEILERDGEGRPTSVRMVTGAMGMKANSVLTLNYPEDGLEWHLAEGDMMTQNDSLWQLKPNDAGGTDVELEMALGLKWPLPEFMLKQIITKGVNDNLKAVKRISEDG